MPRYFETPSNQTSTENLTNAQGLATTQTANRYVCREDVPTELVKEMAWECSGNCAWILSYCPEPDDRSVPETQSLPREELRPGRIMQSELESGYIAKQLRNLD